MFESPFSPSEHANIIFDRSIVEAILSPLRFLVDRRRIDICQLINFTIKRVFGWRADFPLRSRAINDNELENRLETAGNSRFKRFTFASVSPRYRLDWINFPSTLDRAANYRLACKIILPSLFLSTSRYYFTIINAACFSSRPMVTIPFLVTAKAHAFSLRELFFPPWIPLMHWGMMDRLNSFYRFLANELR